MILFLGFWGWRSPFYKLQAIRPTSGKTTQSLVVVQTLYSATMGAIRQAIWSALGQPLATLAKPMWPHLSSGPDHSWDGLSCEGLDQRGIQITPNLPGGARWAQHSVIWSGWSGPRRSDPSRSRHPPLGQPLSGSACPGGGASGHSPVPFWATPLQSGAGGCIWSRPMKAISSTWQQVRCISPAMLDPFKKTLFFQPLVNWKIAMCHMRPKVTAQACTKEQMILIQSFPCGS